MNDRLQTTLRQLRLSGLAESLDIRLQEAAGHQLSHAEFLELVLQDEVLVRNQRQIDRRVKTANFREVKALDEFDWAFNPSIPRKQVFDLATCRFIRESRDVLLIGPPGTGKSFLAQAIGYLAIKQGMLVLYRSIFDVVRDFLHDDVEPPSRGLGTINRRRPQRDGDPRPLPASCRDHHHQRQELSLAQSGSVCRHGRVKTSQCADRLFGEEERQNGSRRQR
jgi:hypothetical protein